MQWLSVWLFRPCSSALGDLVALGHAHAFVLGGSIASTCGGRFSSVARSDFPRVGHLCGSERTLATATKQEDSHLDAGTTDLDFGCIGVCDKVVGKLHAYVQIS